MEAIENINSAVHGSDVLVKVLVSGCMGLDGLGDQTRPQALHVTSLGGRWGSPYAYAESEKKGASFLVSGQPITETPTILIYLAKTRPDAGLLPFGADELENARVIADLYGDWSALDGYIFWVHNRLQVSGFDLSEFPRFSAHGIRMMQVPAVQRAWAQRSALQEQLKSEGLLPPAPAVNRV